MLHHPPLPRAPFPALRTDPGSFQDGDVIISSVVSRHVLPISHLLDKNITAPIILTPTVPQRKGRRGWRVVCVCGELGTISSLSQADISPMYARGGGHAGISMRPILFGFSHISVLTCSVLETGAGLSPTWVHKSSLPLSAIGIQ